jgi:DNA-binding transcriptional LysR family regulator
VFEYADRIFELYAEMENGVREITGEISGALTIGASTTIAEYMLPTLLGDFNARYPEVSIHLKVSNSEGIVSMVESNAIDLGVVESPVGNKNLVVETCKQDQLVAIVPPGHPLAAKDQRSTSASCWSIRSFAGRRAPVPARSSTTTSAGCRLARRGSRWPWSSAARRR